MHENLDAQTNRVQRWKLLLAEYNITWTYIKGKDNASADMMSRCCYTRETDQTSQQTSITRKTPKDAQDEERILSKVHNVLCHPSPKTMEMALRKYWNIKELRKKTRKIRDHCKKCQETMKTTVKYGHINGNIGTTEPWLHISSDIYGPIETQEFEEGSTSNKFYILTIIDRCTRWAECFKLNSLNPDEIIKHFETWISDKPKPRTCLTDQGRSYISTKFFEFLKTKEIKHLITTPYNPTGNSISERINQTITRVLQTNKKQRLSIV